MVGGGAEAAELGLGCSAGATALVRDANGPNNHDQRPRRGGDAGADAVARPNACSKASATFVMLAKRSAGSLAIIFKQIFSRQGSAPISGLTAEGLGGISAPIFLRTEVRAPVNGNRPVSMTYNTTPRL